MAQRSLNHNVYLCQELMEKYGRKGISPRCTIKIDIQKAYDTVEWELLKEVMKGLNFPKKLIHW